MEGLEAEFNRWTLSRHDFEEAHEYLSVFDSHTDATVQRALLSASIVAYARPFSRHYENPKAHKNIPRPDAILDSASLALHDKIIKLRNQGIAHSDYERKPTARVPIDSPGVMSWSKPFNPLSEGIDIAAFRALARRMQFHCWDYARALNHQMNNASPPLSTPPEMANGASLNVTLPLSMFKRSGDSDT